LFFINLLINNTHKGYFVAHISHKLKNSLEGALAGGGDPATSPLYVFGPFIKLVMVAGFANIAFGGAIWLAVLTIAVVSAMYRLVMQWITDGSGGSGLSEEEFGGWAVKINAAVTFVEYTLTFLVSMAAMVTFISDRIPALSEDFLGIPFTTILAVVLSLAIGWLVNRGPKMATRAFGPATAGVLILLWIMIFATLIKTGLHLPEFSLQAFVPPTLKFTIGGYVRILAVMTGIEVFANLVAAYGGTPAQKSKKAFGSLIIIMGTTALTMLIVGPAIFSLSDPSNLEVSVFTQAMDQLLPAPLPYAGTLVGIFVLMSASAASAQGLQNLAVGLKERHYIPAGFGDRNKFDVADKPVWLEVGIVSFCFVVFGTHEETYLSLYAVGVFVLLSLTGWAVTKRLIREARQKISFGKIGFIFGTMIAALLTTGATAIIIEERFFEGAWTYLVFLPVIYLLFTYFRNQIGAPSPEMDYLGQIDSTLLAGFGFGQSASIKGGTVNGENVNVKLTWMPQIAIDLSHRHKDAKIGHVLTLLDGSDYAAQAIPMARFICESTGAKLTLLSVLKEGGGSAAEENELSDYLCKMAETIHATGIQVNCMVRYGATAEVTKEFVEEKLVDMVIVTTHGKSGRKNWMGEGLSSKLVHLLDIPVLLVQEFESGPAASPHFSRILVALDGSTFSEQTLPYARSFAKQFDCELMLLSVPAVPESEKYRAPASVIAAIRSKKVTSMRKFLESVAESLRKDDIAVKTIVTGSYPARTITEIGKREGVDLIMITSQGRGGLNLLFTGSVAQQVVQLSDTPVFIVPIQRELETEE
jgi:nucleotide-binding universal stress UspA family protein